jgi:phage protein D
MSLDALSQLLPGASAAPAVRRPTLALAFGSGSSNDWAQSVVSVTIELGLAPAVDVVEIELAPSGQAPAVAVGDAGTVALGYADGATDLVFTGQIESVGRSLVGATRVTATNGGATMAALRVVQSYEQQCAGDVVRDLAGQAGVALDAVEDGIALAFYVVDGRQSAYRQVASLARACGFLSFFTPGGKLRFASSSTGQPVQTFSYAVDLLALTVTDSVPIIGAVTVVGEGAAGSQGQDAWPWLIKDPSAVTGSAGSGAPARTVADRAMRSQDAARNAAAGIVNSAGLLNLAGRLRAPAAPNVDVGSTIAISGAPQPELNGTCLVLGVRHRLSRSGGFTTELSFSKLGAGGGPGDLLGLAAGLAGGLL